MESSIVVLSGGTATNDLVPLFDQLCSRVSYVLPILDNGGSTSEIIRVIGGPAIGDIRSRLSRLIPNELAEIRELLCYRLSDCSETAKIEWDRIIHGSHALWHSIPTSTKEIIRSFLLHIHVEILKKNGAFVDSVLDKQFNFLFASIGNMFLTALRLFTGSLNSAIELFVKITGISIETEILPCINTNFSYHISAHLVDGSIITGQSQISHPSSTQMHPLPPKKFGTTNDRYRHTAVNGKFCKSTKSEDCPGSSDEEVGNTPFYTHPELKKSQLHFTKTSKVEPLTSRIKRIMYISPYGHEICPTAQNRVLLRLLQADMIIYSVGSLMTSIIPIVILKGSGRAIAHNDEIPKKRVLFLNGNQDRETYGLDAFDHVKAIVELAQYLMKQSGQDYKSAWTLFVTHVFYIRNSEIFVDVDAFGKLGISCVAVDGSAAAIDKYDLNDLREKLVEVARIP